MIVVGSNIIAQNQWEEKDILTINNEYLMPAQYCDGISYSTDNGILKIYNQNFECIKSIRLVSANLNDGGIMVFCLTKNIFTSNNKYEFILRKWWYNSEGEYFESNGIYNEDGNLLYNIKGESGANYDGDIQSCPYIIGNKLVIKTPTGSQIFTLHKSVNNPHSAISSVQQNNPSRLYPNPARQSVTLEYNIKGYMQEMQIVNMQGKVVANYLLDPSQKQVKINTSNYKKGVYIYRYGNNSGKFVVE